VDTVLFREMSYAVRRGGVDHAARRHHTAWQRGGRAGAGVTR